MTETPWSRAGVSEADYRLWSAGGKVSSEVKAAIIGAADREPMRRIQLGEKGQPIGVIETPRPQPPEGGDQDGSPDGGTPDDA